MTQSRTCKGWPLCMPDPVCPIRDRPESGPGTVRLSSSYSMIWMAWCRHITETTWNHYVDGLLLGTTSILSWFHIIHHEPLMTMIESCVNTSSDDTRWFTVEPCFPCDHDWRDTHLVNGPRAYLFMLGSSVRWRLLTFCCLDLCRQ